MNKKNQQLITYLVSKHTNCTITSLMKLSYLVDLFNMKESGNKISSYEYIRFHYGPFCNEISQDIDELMENGAIEPKMEYDPAFGNEYVVYNLKKDIGTSELSENEIENIDVLLDKFRGYGAKALTLVAYKTDPMKDLGATLGGNEGMRRKLI